MSQTYFWVAEPESVIRFGLGPGVFEIRGPETRFGDLPIQGTKSKNIQENTAPEVIWGVESYSAG